MGLAASPMPPARVRSSVFLAKFIMNKSIDSRFPSPLSAIAFVACRTLLPFVLAALLLVAFA